LRRLRRIGDSELRVSPIGLGCNNFGRVVDLDGTRAIVDAALDAGVNFLDTAESYGKNRGDSERLLGEALRGRRDQVVLATKFGGGPAGGHARGNPDYIRSAVEGSLQRLQTDYVDLLYYHAPDGLTPIAETLNALHELVERGTVRAIGCSNFSAAEISEADHTARSRGATRFVAVQNQYSLLERDADADVIPLCHELGIGFVAYFPLANGLLTGKYTRGEPPPEGTRLSRWGQELLSDETFDELDRLTAFADGQGRSLHELALAATASTPGVASVLVGATTPEQVRANASVDWELADSVLEAIPRVEGRGVHTGPAR
jgi:aryl-alcohol dehydrogenase-like predicted oxidoreductase